MLPRMCSATVSLDVAIVAIVAVDAYKVAVSDGDTS